MRKLFHLTLTAALLYALTCFLNACSEEADCSMTNNRGMIVCNLYHIDPSQVPTRSSSTAWAK